ncbi:MAG: rod shape-determining protein MreC [Pseudoflavonifractor sp.]|nr:rod shape-determining protein MreC [Pseudoflavonifractor sp.]MDY3020424.1 rod shape-determining protein MreC [Oscillospiraceae bacterium]
MKDFLKHNGILILVIAVLLALITAVLSLTFGGMADPLSNAAGVIATPFRNGINAFVNWTEGVYSDAFQRESMQEELEALKKENAELKKQARDGAAASRENERLRNLLGLKTERPDFQLQEAAVTARSASNWSSTLTISKGSAADVAAGDCVVDEYGNLVGVISEVGLNWSRLITVVDVDLEVGGLIARTDGAAILEGDFQLMGQGRLKLAYLPEDTRLLAGDTILTSGLKSGDTAAYPSGLVVGYVEEVRSDDSGMSDYAVLTPAAELGKLEQVFVIKEFSMVE